jgi:poly(ADP-ribose) glycohydrolase ARH3
MRVAPVGALFHDNLPRLRRVAEQQATITHTHVLGTQGAVIQAATVAAATRRDPTRAANFDAPAFLDEVTGTVGPLEPWYAEAMDDVGRLLPIRPPGKTVVEVLGNGIEAHESVPAAIYSFLAHPDSFEEAVVFAVRLGGDADTIGAMTGAIVGAYHGASAIPERWLAALENGPKGRDYVRDLADRLFATWQQQQRGRVA